jgi:membrane-associated phospholipid phosphatase
MTIPAASHAARSSPPTAPGKPAAGFGEATLPYHLRLLRRAAFLVVLGLLAFSIDVPVAAWFKDGGWPAETPRFVLVLASVTKRLITLSEVFAHTLCVAIILALTLRLDPGLAWPSFRRQALRWPSFQPTLAQELFARMLSATITAGLLADLIKLIVDRVRPRAADFSMHATVWDTFRASVIDTVTGSHSNVNSFPSGHSAMAAGLAATLAWRYPRGRWFFAIFAAMAAAQRILSSAHFPSDTCFGAAVGLAGASLFLRAPHHRSPPVPVNGDAGVHGGPPGDAV